MFSKSSCCCSRRESRWLKLGAWNWIIPTKHEKEQTSRSLAPQCWWSTGLEVFEFWRGFRTLLLPWAAGRPLLPLPLLWNCLRRALSEEMRQIETMQERRRVKICLGWFNCKEIMKLKLGPSVVILLEYALLFRIERAVVARSKMLSMNSGGKIEWSGSARLETPRYETTIVVCILRCIWSIFSEVYQQVVLFIVYKSIISTHSTY